MLANSHERMPTNIFGHHTQADVLATNSINSGRAGSRLMGDLIMLLRKLHQAVVVICRRLHSQAELLMLASAADEHSELVMVWVVDAGLLC